MFPLTKAKTDVVRSSFLPKKHHTKICSTAVCILKPLWPLYKVARSRKRPNCKILKYLLMRQCAGAAAALWPLQNTCASRPTLFSRADGISCRYGLWKLCFFCQIECCNVEEWKLFQEALMEKFLISSKKGNLKQSKVLERFFSIVINERANN